MNEVLRYEEAIQSQLSQLPLPDENFAWQEMKKLLEEDDDDAVIIPPVRKGCAGLAALLLAGLVAGWLIVKPMRWFRSSSPVSTSTEQKQEPERTGETGQKSTAGFQTDKNEPIIPGNATGAMNSNETGVSEQKDSSLVRTIKETDPTVHAEKTTAGPESPATVKNIVTQRTTSSSYQTGQIPPGQRPAQKKAQQKIQTYTPGISKNPAKNTKEGYDPSSVLPLKKTNGTREKTKTPVSGTEQPPLVVQPPAANVKTVPDLPVVSTETPVKKDTVTQAVPPLPVTEPPADAKEEKTDKKFWVATGIAITQQVPLGGQQSTPYNYYGRRSSLADYIPSLYVRLHREQKWFVQGEFRYGAPQYTKEFVYSNIVRSDSFGQNRTTTSYRVKKTFYHQLPVSFNYYIRPGWSIGAGVVVNKFYGAVSEEDIRRQIPGTTRDTLISQKLVYSNARTDSSFEKINLQWLFETQYKWKRFTLGARYSMGLQPYVRFTDAVTGQPREEKNHNLNIFLRFELWNSRKNK